MTSKSVRLSVVALFALVAFLYWPQTLLMAMYGLLLAIMILNVAQTIVKGDAHVD